MFFGFACFYPKALRQLNRGWFALGMLLHKITNPLLLGLIFFGAITPLALFFRITGRDALRLKLDPQLKSYWIRRPVAGPKPEQIRHQF